ncbi:MAG TPA: hypothetical protein VMO00_03940 [Methylomirabilota bacterium]|nr:hypothetical protein [Methylomirabilota bacterium]
MVSNTLKMDQKEVVKVLKRLKRESGDTSEYQKLRRDLPKDWPI